MPRFRRIAVAFAALLTAGCYDSRFGEPDGNAPGEPATETAESRGVLQIGRPPAVGSGYATDYIGSQPALAAVLARNGENLHSPTPALRRISELTPALCGTLVRLDGLRYTPEDLSASTWSGYKRFTDSDDNTVYTYVRTYARFADTDVPVGTVSLTGILQYDAAGDGRYILKLRDESDCRP